MNSAAKICTIGAEQLLGKASVSSVHPYLWFNRSSTPQSSRLNPGLWCTWVTAGSWLLDAVGRLGDGGHSPCQPARGRKRITRPVTVCSRRCFWKHPSRFARRGYACCCWSELCTLKQSTLCPCFAHPGQPAAPNTLQARASLWQTGFLLPNCMLLARTETRRSPTGTGCEHSANERRKVRWPGCTYFVIWTHWSSVLPWPLVEHGVF